MKYGQLGVKKHKLASTHAKGVWKMQPPLNIHEICHWCMHIVIYSIMATLLSYIYIYINLRFWQFLLHFALNFGHI